jgi:AcrR family transcriptional regulator
MNKLNTGIKRTSRKQQAQLRRQQIIDAALKIFAEKGFVKTTIKDISQTAGTSQGLMYHYFKSKEELLAAVIESHSFIAQLRRITSSTHTKPVRQVLYEITNGFYNLLASNKELISIVLSEMQTNPVFKKKWAIIPMEGVTLISNYLLANISAGKLKRHNTKVAAHSMLYTIVMLFITRDMFSWSRLTVEQYIKETIDIFLDGIAVQSLDE